MSYLVDLYKEQPKTIAQLDALQKLLQNPSFEKVEVMFLIEILSQTLRQQHDFTRFITIVLEYIDKNLSYKNSIFILRIFKAIINTRFFLPLAYYIAKIIEEAIKTNNTISTGKTYDYDAIRLSSDDLHTQELQLFVIAEAIALIRGQCRIFGENIGFPEYAFVVCNELRSRCKVGAYKDIVGDLIKSIMDRKAYIESERAKSKLDMLSIKNVSEFESKLEPSEI